MGTYFTERLTRRTGAQLVMDVESSVGAVRTVSRFLNGNLQPLPGIGPPSRAVAKFVTRPPKKIRKKAFQLAGRSQALPARRIGDINVDAIDRWVVEEYTRKQPDQRQYPAVMVGAVSGAAYFLATALGIPYLPQTTLVSVVDGKNHPDDIRGAMKSWAPAAQQIAQQNPRISVHHMHDPAQDRPMMEKTAFFRLKRLSLGPVYEQFLRERLEPGGAIITLENSRSWRAARTGERSFFQFGCLGGLPEEEYHTGSTRITQFLGQQNSSFTAWSPPDMTERTPDGEWGWDPALGDDVDRLIHEQGWERRRLHQNEPQDASAFIAELFRDWYRRLGWQDNRLLAQTYTLLDPRATLATGSIPFWNRFHMQPSFDVLREYLESTDTYDEILVSLFSHGLVSPGLVSFADWQSLARRFAHSHGAVIGTDEHTYPIDPGGPVRYQDALRNAGPHRELPTPLTLAEVDAFAERYRISHDASPVDHTDDVTGEGIRNPVRWSTQ